MEYNKDFIILKEMKVPIKYWDNFEMWKRVFQNFGFSSSHPDISQNIIFFFKKRCFILIKSLARKPEDFLKKDFEYPTNLKRPNNMEFHWAKIR